MRVVLLLSLLFILSCEQKREMVKIEFLVDGIDVKNVCEETFKYQGDSWKVHDFRFYVHNIKVVDQNGEEHPVTLSSDAMWQSKSIVLIDLENGKGSCVNGTPEINNAVYGISAFPSISALRFTIGVPPKFNHDKFSEAQAPLNYGFMHWSWLGGYKFTRISMEGNHHHLRMHLGSTGCTGALQEGVDCRYVNTVPVEVPVTSEGGIHRVNILIKSLMDGASARDETICMGEAEPQCRDVYQALPAIFKEKASI